MMKVRILVFLFRIRLLLDSVMLLGEKKVSPRLRKGMNSFKSPVPCQEMLRLLFLT